MANAAFDRGLARLADYNWDLDAVDLGVMLVLSTYTFDPTHDTVADVEAHETSGAGYGRRAVAAAARSTSQSASGGLLLVTAGTVTWSNLSAGTDLRVILFFADGGLAASTNDLLGHYDSGVNAPIDTNGQSITLDFNALLGAIRLKRP
jgi:hypothetical protein